ncbi:MAG: hypothetical protein LUG83_01245 [Lachnospiraceae bacterium]|nr:hypothetical protein [Lachnospiraceae bacterium]
MKCYIPSYEYERRTGAFNRTLWGFVALISMFTVGLGAMVFLEALVVDLLGVVTTVYWQYSSIFTVCFFSLIVLVAIPSLLKFVMELMTAYRFDGNSIIKGRIMRNALNYAPVNNMAALVKIVELNMKEGFAEAYFETDVYKKKTYTNARLVKETKYCLHFESNNGRLVIPKIYKDITRTDGKECPSLGIRIAVRSLIVFAVFFVFGCIDVYTGYANNSEIKSDVTVNSEPLDEKITSYGYELYQHSEFNSLRYVYRKTVEKDGTSFTNEVTLEYDTNGTLENVELEIYLPDESYLDEAEYLVSLVVGLSDAQKAEFMEYVKRSVEEGFSTDTYCKMTGDVTTIRNDTSEGCISIHTW